MRFPYHDFESESEELLRCGERREDGWDGEKIEEKKIG